MFAKKLFKNPILIIGILFMSIFLMNLAGKKTSFFGFRNNKLIPTSCRAVLVMLNRRIPATWKTDCEGNNLIVYIKFNLPDSKVYELSAIRGMMYRSLANNMIFIAKNSPQDNLERTDFVRLLIEYPKLVINALTEGKFIYKLATIRDKEMLTEHLKTTVHVKEEMK